MRLLTIATAGFILILASFELSCYASPSSLTSTTKANAGRLKMFTTRTKSSDFTTPSIVSPIRRKNNNNNNLISKYRLERSISSLRGGNSYSSSSSSSPTWSSSPLGIQQQQQQGRQSYGSSSSSRKQQRYPSLTDVENDPKEMVNAFLTRDSRNTFIARVYSILSIQLIVTSIFIFALSLNPNIKYMLHATRFGQSVPILSVLLSTIAYAMMASSLRIRRSSGGLKWSLLILFTLGEALSVGFISSFYKFQTVMKAMIVTALSTLCISIYTITNKNSKYDLSQWGLTLSNAGLVFVIYGLLHLLELLGIIPKGLFPYKESIYSFCGSVLFSFYLAHHTKMIVGGKHTKYQLNEKDYILGAMSLYNDIINMFIYILRFIGSDGDP